MKKERLIFLGKAFVTVILMTVMLYFFVKDWQNTATFLVDMKLRFFVLAMFIAFMSHITGYMVWQTALWAIRYKESAYTIFRVSMLGTFYNNLLLSSIGGDAVKLIELKSRGSDLKTAFSGMLIDRITSFYTLGLFGLVSLTIALYNNTAIVPIQNLLDNSKTLIEAGIEVDLVAIRLPVAISLYCIAFIFTFGTAFTIYNEKTYGFIKGLLEKIGIKVVRELSLKIFSSFHMLKGKRRFALVMVALIIVTQALKILITAAAGMALNLDIPIYYYFIFVPIIGLASALPISISGIGVREVIGGMLFASVIPASQFNGNTVTALAVAASLNFAAHLATMGTNLICGFAFFMPKKEIIKTEAS